MPRTTRVLRATASQTSVLPGKGNSTETSSPSSSWSSTLQLPRSRFPPRPIKADRAKYLERCTTELYAWQKHARHDQAPFRLHDGPPYANGSLHIGHALNKILKDITLRTQLAKGRRVEYVPGWDCHGLPIELKALQGKARGSSGDAASQNIHIAGKEQERDGAKATAEAYNAVEVRRRAQELATETVEQQRAAFRDWAVLGDWDNAWTTMQPDFELRQLEVFRRMLEKGLIYRRFKPVYWSPSTRTALAEGELEYKSDHSSIAVFVRFEVLDQEPARELFGIPSGCSQAENSKISFLIWTTTPWTLPANKAIAVHKDISYVCTYFEGIGYLIIADTRVDEVKRICKAEGDNVVYGPLKGSKLVNLRYKNDAFTADQISPVYHAEHVSADSGTGLVHTAPGHGMDDYKLCGKHDVQPFAPVDEAGRFTGDAFSPGSPADDLVGREVLGDGTIGILKYLKTAGSAASTQIIKSYKYTHSYPYDWRSKQPIIIRATAQWFADLSEIRNTTFKALENIKFIPTIGKKRLASMLGGRAEWCISRQRAWGVPIPALYRKDSGEALLTPESVSHVIATIRERGIDAWWTDASDEKAWVHAKHRGVDYVRGTDTMDVWFDSGTSWTHMGRDADEKSIFKPEVADVYLEGSDQHRGWFQSSILTKIAYDSAAGARIASAPYKTLITHGFTLDGTGKKMSKSEGNVISPDEITNGTLLPPLKRKQKASPTGSQNTAHDAMGTDALRFLVAGMDFTKDVQISPTTLKVMHSNLAKLRITYRLLTGLLADFNPATANACSIRDLGLVNQIALLHLQEVSQKVWSAMEEYDYYKAVPALVDYINADLSAFFIEAIKDRMYADAPRDQRRQHTQFVLWHIFEELNSILRPLTPLLVEEAKAYMPQDISSEDGVKVKRLFDPAEEHEPRTHVLQLRQDIPIVPSSATGNGEAPTFGDIRSLLPVIGQLNTTVKSLLEEKRSAKVIGSSLQAHAVIRDVSPPDKSPHLRNLLLSLPNLESELADLFVVSKVTYGIAPVDTSRGWSTATQIEHDEVNFEIVVFEAPESRCDRCWKYTATKDRDLCQRCEDVVQSDT